MNFSSKYNIGQLVWSAFLDTQTNKRIVTGPLTIGQIRIEHTDSPGLPNEQIFENYKPHKGYKESYMCVETGVESGIIHYTNQLFPTRKEAEAEPIENLQSPGS